jgi:ABC-type phosphate/phosphonate transport system substrate-binding protein
VSAERLASLGMYDQPWLHAANDALWADIARRLRAAGWRDVPARLARDRPLEAIWRDPRLILAQTCGYPLATALRDAVTVVVRPLYGWPGCAAGTHRSFVVVRADAPFGAMRDLAGACAAINGRDSNTGMNLLRHALAPFAANGRFLGRVVETGAHLASLAAVSAGKADLAAIDCVTFGLAARHRPSATAGLRVLSETAPSPTLPFVAAGDAGPAEVTSLRVALGEAIADPANAEAVAALGLCGVEPAKLEDYAVLLGYEDEAARAGYPVLT